MTNSERILVIHCLELENGIPYYESLWDVTQQYSYTAIQLPSSAVAGPTVLHEMPTRGIGMAWSMMLPDIPTPPPTPPGRSGKST